MRLSCHGAAENQSLDPFRSGYLLEERTLETFIEIEDEVMHEISHRKIPSHFDMSSILMASIPPQSPLSSS